MRLTREGLQGYNAKFPYGKMNAMLNLHAKPSCCTCLASLVCGRRLQGTTHVAGEAQAILRSVLPDGDFQNKLHLLQLYPLGLFQLRQTSTSQE